MFESYPDYEYLLASTQLVLAMLGMGALLGPKDFAEVFRRPRSLIVGLATQLAAVPLVAAALGRILPVEAGIAGGLILVAAVPGGTMSNVITHFGRGNIALSISLTAITSVGALATAPVILRFFLGEYLPAEFEMPVARVAFEIGVSLLIPLFTGMLVGMVFTSSRERFSRWCIRGSLSVIGLMAVGAAGSGRLDVTAYGIIGPVAVLLFCAASQAAALVASRLAGVEPDDRLALVVEVTVRNTNLAVLLKASLFPAVAGRADLFGDGLFFVALLYGGVAILFALPAVIAHRRGVGQ